MGMVFFIIMIHVGTHIACNHKYVFNFMIFICYLLFRNKILVVANRQEIGDEL